MKRSMVFGLFLVATGALTAHLHIGKTVTTNLPGGEAWGRPVDVLVMPDGALLVSDNHAGVIYRISYQR